MLYVWGDNDSDVAPKGVWTSRFWGRWTARSETSWSRRIYEADGSDWGVGGRDSVRRLLAVGVSPWVPERHAFFFVVHVVPLGILS